MLTLSGLEKYLLGWQMDFHESHPLNTDLNALLEGVHTLMRKKFTEEILTLNRVKFPPTGQRDQ